MEAYDSEVLRFRQWADHGAPDLLGLGHGAEWECNYPHWERLLAAVQERISTAPGLTGAEQHDLLYVLARDNEDEQVAEMLKTAPRLVEELLPLALAHPDPAARWQIAMILRAALGDGAGDPLGKFTKDDDEYVRRRARAALGTLGTA